MPKIETKIDMSEIDKMLRNLNNLEEREVSAGFTDTPHEGSGMSMGELAIIHEHGVRSEAGSNKPWKIPPRPFMEQASHLLTNSIDKESRLVVENALKGKESITSKYLDDIADINKDTIQESIEMQNFTPLSPITVRIKKDKGARHVTEMLLESGELFEGIETEVK
jgi:hypothetical protein